MAKSLSSRPSRRLRSVVASKKRAARAAKPIERTPAASSIKPATAAKARDQSVGKRARTKAKTTRPPASRTAALRTAAPQAPAKSARRAAATPATRPKWVYAFGDGKAEGSAEMRELLGGKGANLAEMANIGLPVPPGFTITTEVCTYFYAHGRTYPPELEGEVEAALRRPRQARRRQEARRCRAIRCWSRCAPGPAPRCPA